MASAFKQFGSIIRVDRKSLVYSVAIHGAELIPVVWPLLRLGLVIFFCTTYQVESQVMKEWTDHGPRGY